MYVSSIHSRELRFRAKLIGVVVGQIGKPIEKSKEECMPFASVYHVADKLISRFVQTSNFRDTKDQMYICERGKTRRSSTDGLARI